MTSTREQPLYRVRRSPIHGTGVFAVRLITKGTRIVEYLGERVSHAEADRRYEDKAADDNHTFLFTVDSRLVIDAGVGGNEARWINHACDPNCETVIEKRRVFIEAARDIAPGEELAYDYMIQREPGDPPDIEKVFACRCGSPRCRGTMLLPPKKKSRKRAAARGAGGGRSESGSAGRGGHGKSGTRGTSTKSSKSSKSTKSTKSSNGGRASKAGKASKRGGARQASKGGKTSKGGSGKAARKSPREAPSARRAARR